MCCMLSTEKSHEGLLTPKTRLRCDKRFQIQSFTRMKAHPTVTTDPRIPTRSVATVEAWVTHTMASVFVAYFSQGTLGGKVAMPVSCVLPMRQQPESLHKLFSAMC